MSVENDYSKTVGPSSEIMIEQLQDSLLMSVLLLLCDSAVWHIYTVMTPRKYKHYLFIYLYFWSEFSSRLFSTLI